MMALRGSPYTGFVTIVLLSALTPSVHAQLAPSSGPASSTLLSDTTAPQAPLLTYGIDTGVGETDNVALTPNNKISQTMSITDLDFALNEQSRLLAANVTGDFSYLDYLQGQYGGQLLGRLDGLARFSIVPDRLTWTVQDDFGQAALDPYTPVTPGNLQHVDYFTTGPELLLRIAGVNFIDATARYARATYSGLPFDSNRASAFLAVGRDVSAGGTLSVNAGTEKVWFDNTSLNTDFDRTSVYGRYLLQGSRTNVEVDLGATTIRNSAHTTYTSAEGDELASSVYQPAYSSTGGLAKLQLIRQLSPAAKITLAGGRELTDASSSFSTLQNGAISLVGTAAAIQTTAPYTSDFASALWSYVRNRTTLAASARWEKDVYVGLPEFDSRHEGVEVDLERKMTPTLSAQLQARYTKYDYPNATAAEIVSAGSPVSSEASLYSSTDYGNGLAGFGLAWRHGRALEVRLRYDHNFQHATIGNASYSENRVFLTVGYRPAPAPASEPGTPVAPN
jgi:hypothetical protein